MAKMKIVAIRMSKEPISVKVLYEKNGLLYVRTGDDGFTKGQPTRAPMSSLINKWGFRKVENPPEFRDSDELIDNITAFEMLPSGKVRYSG
jgi:hypothetical protein